MIIKIGNMWDKFGDYDLFCVTTNSQVIGELLTMGAGAALQSRRRFKGLDYRLGRTILNTCGEGGVYGLIFDTETKIGAFQTKGWPWEGSSLNLIRTSVEALERWLEHHPFNGVSCNYPGIGLGGLKEADVEPLLIHLPDRVHFWKDK